MRALPAAGLALCLSSPALAQFTMPPGYDIKEAPDSSQHLGGHPDQRFQILNGDWKGTGPKIFKKLALRRDSTSGSTNYGRSWTNVQLQLADSDFAAMSTTFTQNHKSTPTTVFSAAVTWPSTTGKPGTTPGPWGNFVTPGDVAFPFSSTYTYSSTSDFCVDFIFSGGRLVTGSWSPTTLMPYYHDGVSRWLSVGGSTPLYGNTKCTESSHTSPPFFAASIVTYAKNTGSSTTSDKIGIHFHGQRLARTAPCMGLITATGSTTGTPFLASCNRLHLDLSRPAISLPFTTDASGSYSTSSNTTYVAYNPAYVGQTLWTQAGFDDGTTKKLELSLAGQATVLVQPVLHKHVRLYAYTYTYPYGTMSDGQVPAIYLTP